MKALLLDVGNTRLKWGIGHDGELGRTGHVKLSTLRDQGLAALTTKLPRRIDTVLVSNVAGPGFGKRLSGVLGIHCDCEVHFVRTQREAYGVTNSYKVPRRMGVDRWVAMIGAWAEFGQACLVVDAGTAITIDALDDDGQHLGGQILPGVPLMLATLSRDTSGIGAVGQRVKPPEQGLAMFANSTAAAVHQGAWNAVAGAVERAINTLRSEGYDPFTVLTGGDASRMLAAFAEAPELREHLVLEGLLTILDFRA